MLTSVSVNVSADLKMQKDYSDVRIERAAQFLQPPARWEVIRDKGVFLQHQSGQDSHRAVGQQPAIAVDNLDGGRRTHRYCSRDESLRREHQPVKALRGVCEGVGGAEGRTGGGDGAAEVGPVARIQVGTVLQLIPGSSLRAPSKIQRGFG